MTTMTAKEPPLCRWCAKPLKKYLRTVYIEPLENEAAGGYVRSSNFARTIFTDTPPKTRAECQTLSNWQVVSVTNGDGGIRQFREWDGESYDDAWDYFCSHRCAAATGRAAVRDHRWGSESYLQAIEKRLRPSPDDSSATKVQPEGPNRS